MFVSALRKPALGSLFIAVYMVVVASAALAQPVILFDNCHAQTASNADWTIYGGYSDMGDAAIFLGCKIKSADRGPITDDMLKGVSMFVTPEPNSKFKKNELAALEKFVMGGGKLFLISDHEGADRNHDGWDAVMILNEMEEFTGIHFNELWFSEHPVEGENVPHQITEGVVAGGTWGGTSMKATGHDAKSLMFESHGGGYVTISTPGKGRIVAMGDSSPYDDGTGAPGDKLYDGWNNPGFNHERLCYNSYRWLLKRDNSIDNDLKCFTKLLRNSTDKEVKDIHRRVELAINKHEKTIRKCKSPEVKATWIEDLQYLRELKSIIESGDFSRTFLDRVRDRITQFNKLHD
jgi:hypothetical protein